MQVEEFYINPVRCCVRHRRNVTTPASTTHAADAVAQRAPNAIVQKVAYRASSNQLSLSCNNDITQDTLDAIAARGLTKPLLIAEIDPQHRGWAAPPPSIPISSTW